LLPWLKELVHRLLKNQKDQETIRDTQQEKLLAAVEAQAKTIAKLEATIQGQSKELGEIRTQLRSEKAGRASYSEALHRAPSSVRSTTTTLVGGIVGPGPGPGVNEDRTVITINTARVKKEKQDTTVMWGILTRSLTSFKATAEVGTVKYSQTSDPVILTVKYWPIEILDCQVSEFSQTCLTV
jgi:hypothetical protein